ncbi:unnamed protein product [Prorocentrum cordatum]|uniref:Uncharacterized protein n=1 Tax=Prorocentrum cordatum TaxID=2364126 RepID=A0ABN9V732_9DINO|nr:unnamed protein product [Polarella glacialis]
MTSVVWVPGQGWPRPGLVVVYGCPVRRGVVRPAALLAGWAGSDAHFPQPRHRDGVPGCRRIVSCLDSVSAGQLAALRAGLEACAAGRAQVVACEAEGPPRGGEGAQLRVVVRGMLPSAKIHQTCQIAGLPSAAVVRTRLGRIRLGGVQVGLWTVVPTKDVLETSWRRRSLIVSWEFQGIAMACCHASRSSASESRTSKSQLRVRAERSKAMRRESYADVEVEKFGAPRTETTAT